MYLETPTKKIGSKMLCVLQRVMVDPFKFLVTTHFRASTNEGKSGTFER
jgi:transposase